MKIAGIDNHEHTRLWRDRGIENVSHKLSPVTIRVRNFKSLILWLSLLLPDEHQPRINFGRIEIDVEGELVANLRNRPPRLLHRGKIHVNQCSFFNAPEQSGEIWAKTRLIRHVYRSAGAKRRKPVENALQWATDAIG